MPQGQTPPQKPADPEFSRSPRRAESDPLVAPADLEFERRHRSPRERREQRHQQKIAGPIPEEQRAKAPKRRTHNNRLHERRAVAEREFAASAREGAPKPQKTPAKRWKRALRRFLLILAILCLAELIFAAFTAPQFAVKNVDVTGLKITPMSKIDPVAQNLVGQNWLRANTKGAEKSLAILPAVDTVQVSRVLAWPPRLAIRVEERQSFAKIGAGDLWWIVDQKGVPFRPANREDAALFSLTSPELAPQISKKLDPNQWKPMAELVAALNADNQKSGAQWQLRRVYFDRNGDAALRVAGGAHDELLIRLGALRWPEKLKRARVAMKYFQETGRSAETLNLVSFERPTWTPRAAPDAAPEALPNSENPA